MMKQLGIMWTLLFALIMCDVIDAFHSSPWLVTMSLGRHTPRRQRANQAVDNLLEGMYANCVKIRCPFLRRRTTDIVEQMHTVTSVLLLRNDSVSVVDFILRATKANETEKRTDMALADLADVILRDWGYKQTGAGSGKGYYITGRLTKEVYREDCVFEGPDPDMPIRGLRKYVQSASQLFQQRTSRADLTSPLQINEEQRSIRVNWRIEGVLQLPWHPVLKPWTGSTTYLFDEQGLVYRHVETWDISVWDAYLSTFVPSLWKGAPPAPPLSAAILSELPAKIAC